MQTIEAVFEGGVFRPTSPVELPEHSRVTFEPRVVGEPNDPAHQDRMAALLSRRFNSGRGDLAERHNEHQP